MNERTLIYFPLSDKHASLFVCVCFCLFICLLVFCIPVDKLSLIRQHLSGDIFSSLLMPGHLHGNAASKNFDMLFVPKHFSASCWNITDVPLYNHGRIKNRWANSPHNLAWAYLRHSLKSHHKHPVSLWLLPFPLCAFVHWSIRISFSIFVYSLIFCHNPELWSDSTAFFFFFAGPGHIIPLNEPLVCPLYLMHYV